MKEYPFDDLSILDLSNNKISHIFCFDDKFKKLTNLNLGNNNISKEDFEYIKIRTYKLNIDGNNPVIGNSSYNNGIIGYSIFDNTEQGNIITFSDTTSSEAIFYQKESFIGYCHIQGMYPRQKYNKWNEYSYLYV